MRGVISSILMNALRILSHHCFVSSSPTSFIVTRLWRHQLLYHYCRITVICSRHMTACRSLTPKVISSTASCDIMALFHLSL